MTEAEELLALRAEADLLRNELAQVIAENAALRDTCPKSFKRACADSRTAQMLIQLAAGGAERQS